MGYLSASYLKAVKINSYSRKFRSGISVIEALDVQLSGNFVDRTGFDNFQASITFSVPTILYSSD
ncbi:MAG: hypothetical protein GX930_03145 [Clostridia bacterium]|nr:hypothetical protein [Clostridia bacterium]